MYVNAGLCSHTWAHTESYFYSVFISDLYCLRTLLFYTYQHILDKDYGTSSGKPKPPLMKINPPISKHNRRKWFLPQSKMEEVPDNLGDLYLINRSVLGSCSSAHKWTSQNNRIKSIWPWNSIGLLTYLNYLHPMKLFCQVFGTLSLTQS